MNLYTVSDYICILSLSRIVFFHGNNTVRFPYLSGNAQNS